MILNGKFFLKTFFVSLVILSFFLGYFFRENSVGGGLEFYKLSWPIIQSFKNDFLFTIKNYATFGDGTIPFSHIINAYLNPFNTVETNFQLSITIISFFIFLVFAIILKKIFSQISFINILLTSSVVLLLPHFRTSAFWGKNENYGWLFFMVALYFFFKIKEKVEKTPDNRDIIDVIFFCFTSACALYARQALIFLPISYFLYLFFNKANKKIIVTSIISFAIFAIPGLILLWTWGGVSDADNLQPNTFYGRWLHHRYILTNLPILLSFFGFYLLPILIIEILNTGTKVFFNKYFKNFLAAFVFFIFLSQLGILDYLGNYDLAGGAVLKFNYLIQKNNFLLLLFFSSIGFSVLIQLFKENKNNMIILIPILIFFGFPRLLYQEYLEPLILLVFFLGIQTDLHKIYFNKISLSNFIFISYFAIYLMGSIYFKHFAFDSFEKWQIFLGL